jgi:hypothetical protein
MRISYDHLVNFLSSILVISVRYRWMIISNTAVYKLIIIITLFHKIKFRDGINHMDEGINGGSSLWSLLHSSFGPLYVPNICLRILFSNTISLHSSFNVITHVLQPYRTSGNIIVLYILIFKFLETSLENKSVWT